MNTVIAIDGPSASGKSTVSRKLAKTLSFVHVDTGAMYRAFTWYVLEKKVDPNSRNDVRRLIPAMDYETIIDSGHFQLRIDGQDPTPFLRDPEIHASVSPLATIPEVREFLVTKQRLLRNQTSLVMDGRDIGTVVFTDTPLKFFIDCDPEVRAQRRAAQGEKDATAVRDEIDSKRKISPLIRAADAELLDSGVLSVEEITNHILQRYEEVSPHSTLTTP
ncbi:MAG: (d)CMP kinase [Verrucomicrobiota bacterium]